MNDSVALALLVFIGVAFMAFPIVQIWWETREDKGEWKKTGNMKWFKIRSGAEDDKWELHDEQKDMLSGETRWKYHVVRSYCDWETDMHYWSRVRWFPKGYDPNEHDEPCGRDCETCGT